MFLIIGEGFVKQQLISLNILEMLLKLFEQLFIHIYITYYLSYSFNFYLLMLFKIF